MCIGLVMLIVWHEPSKLNKIFGKSICEKMNAEHFVEAIFVYNESFEVPPLKTYPNQPRLGYFKALSSLINNQSTFHDKLFCHYEHSRMNPNLWNMTSKNQTCFQVSGAT